MPGFSAASISPIAASQATIARRMAQDLVRRFDQPRVLHHRLAIADRDAEPGELGDAFRVEMVDGDAAVAAAMLRCTRSAMPAAQRATRLSDSSPP